MAEPSLACGNCANFDPIVKGDGSKPTRHGWCAAKSKYPHQEMLGQTFPPGVDRVGPGKLAKPIIVTVQEIVAHCEKRKAKR